MVTLVMTIRKRFSLVVYKEIILIIWPVNATYELTYVNKFLIALNHKNVFIHFIQLNIFSHMLEKTSLASYYNFTLLIQGISGANLQDLKGEDI